MNFDRRPQGRYNPAGSRAPSAAPTRNGLRNDTLRTNHERHATSEAGALTNGMSNLNINNLNELGALNSAISQQAGVAFTARTIVPTTADRWEVGQIVNVPHIVPCLDPRTPVRVNTNIGPICPKPRFVVIVKIYKTRMIVLPIYSCNKNGVEYKNRDYKATAVSVWNRADRDKEHVDKLTKDAFHVAGDKSFWAGSHVNLNEPLTVEYAWRIEKSSRLDSASTKRLVHWYNIAQLMADQPLAVQQQWFEAEIEKTKNPRALGAAGWQEAPAPPRMTGSYVSRATAGIRR